MKLFKLRDIFFKLSLRTNNKCVFVIYQKRQWITFVRHSFIELGTLKLCKCEGRTAAMESNKSYRICFPFETSNDEWMNEWNELMNDSKKKLLAVEVCEVRTHRQPSRCEDVFAFDWNLGLQMWNYQKKKLIKTLLTFRRGFKFFAFLFSAPLPRLKESAERTEFAFSF